VWLLPSERALRPARISDWPSSRFTTDRVRPGRQGHRELDGQAQARPVGSRLGELDRPPDLGREVELDEDVAAAARIALGERVERAREPDEAIGLLDERFVRRPVGLDDAVAEGLEIALEVRQRRPQLVGGVDDEVAPQALLVLERLGHLVERIGEARELVRTLSLDPGGIVAAGDLPGGRTDPLERAGDPAGEDHGEGQADDDRHGRGREDDARDGLVPHLLRVLRGIACVHHEVHEDVGADELDADHEDRQAGGRGDEARDRDPGGQPAAEHHVPAGFGAAGRGAAGSGAER
jgi:hypothetical protein